MCSGVLVCFGNSTYPYSYIAKGTFLSRKEDFHTKGRFHFKILNSLTIIVYVLSFKRVKEISNSFCMKFTSLLIDIIKPYGSDEPSFRSGKSSFRQCG